jgi:hypothetical protein
MTTFIVAMFAIILLSLVFANKSWAENPFGYGDTLPFSRTDLGNTGLFPTAWANDALQTCDAECILSHGHPSADRASG